MFWAVRISSNWRENWQRGAVGVPLMKAMTLELLVNSLRRAFISSGDIVGAATEGEETAPTAVPEEALVTEDVDFEYFEIVCESSGALAPSTLSTTLPSWNHREERVRNV